MEQQLYRQKSMDRISSPEELNDYLKVTNPGVWLVLAAVVALLAGFFVWSFAGELTTVLPGAAVVKEGQATVVVQQTSPKELTREMPLTVGGKTAAVLDVWKEEGADMLAAQVDLPDGTYQAELTVENIHPISFLLG